MQTQHSPSKLVGLFYAVIAFIVWGFLPLYWKAMEHISAAEILAHRIVWSFLLIILIIALKRRWLDFVQLIKNKTSRLIIILSTLLISSNWFIYIWAVQHNQVVETSLGYYFNPLLSILLAMIILKERLNFWELSAVALAFIGVLITAIAYGRIPWIALCLALSFTFYGLVKKMANYDAMIGLAVETFFIAPIALIYLLFIQVQGSGSFTLSFTNSLLLIFSGVATSLPLLWFAEGAKRLTLSSIGFIQYLAPSISLCLGVFVFKEPFTMVHLVSFTFIWSALLLYSFSQTRFMKMHQPRLFKKAAPKA